MKNQFIIPSIIIAASFLFGCSDPEAEANKLFTEASKLVKDADAMDWRSLEAYYNRKSAIELLEKILVLYPQSSLSVRISEGDLKIQSQSIDEIKEKIILFGTPSIITDVSEGRIENIKIHILKGIDLNKQSEDGFTALHSAALQGHENIIELLIDEGANVNTISNDVGTPLHLAVSMNLKKTVELLISKGADVNAKDWSEMVPLHDGRTPLHTAAMNGHEGIVELLIAKGADVNMEDSVRQTPLNLAIDFDQRETIAMLIANDAIIGLNMKYEYGNTPLHRAAMNDHEEVIELLISKGSDINTKNEHGNTPLHYSAWKGHKEIVELLIDKGVDVNTKDNVGRTPLDMCDDSVVGGPEIADLLRKHGGKTGEELKAAGN